ncbi:MAG: SRPBCC family protein [Ktedonobacterales bacterium]|nr:SRPBCC family protein [Ktedonobacterales bacterium]
MDLKGTHRFTANPQAVWDALHNDAALQASIPGAESVTWQGTDSVKIRLNVGIGPLKGTGTLLAQVAEQTAPSHLRLTFARKDDHNTIDGSALMDLAADSTGTLLTYHVTAQFSGPVAVVDNPLTRPMVDSAVNKFFTQLERHIN